MLTNPIEQLTWIDTDDRYPEDKVVVLMFTPDEMVRVQFGYCVDGEFHYARNHMPVISKVVAYCIPRGPGENVASTEDD